MADFKQTPEMVEAAVRAHLDLHSSHRSCMKAIIRAVAPLIIAQASGREGWKMVPLEIDARMEDAFDDALPRHENAAHPNNRHKANYAALCDSEVLRVAYRAMLAAAPLPVPPAGERG